MSNFVISLNSANLIMAILFLILLFAISCCDKNSKASKSEIKLRNWKIGVDVFFILSNVVFVFYGYKSVIMNIFGIIAFSICCITDIIIQRARKLERKHIDKKNCNSKQIIDVEFEVLD